MVNKMPRPLPQSGRYWKRRIKATMGETPIRPLVELISNSADSYIRLKREGVPLSVGEIKIFYTKKGGWILDQAEGMSRDKLLDKIIIYGEKASGIERGEPVRGHFGMGLKDAALAFRETHIVTIKDGLLNKVKIYLDEEGKPMIDDDGKDAIINKEVTKRDREETGILENGTKITFSIPHEFYRFGRNKPEYVYEKLLNHYQLRKILSSNFYSITFIDGDKNIERPLKYVYPVGELILEDKFYIEYRNYTPFRVDLTVKKANTPLTQRGEYRTGGIVLYFNEDAVLECSLFGLDHEFYAEKFFGEAYIENFAELLKQDEPVLSDERKGLDDTHPFTEKLKEEIYKRLKNKLEEEKKKDLKKEAHIEVPHKSRAIGLINRAIKTELEDMEDMSPPLIFEPVNGLGFYREFLDIPQKESRNVYLVIDAHKFAGEKIVIESESPCVFVDPDSIEINSDIKESKERYIKEKIEILGEDIAEDIRVTASCGNESSSILVNVHENPKLNITEPISFMKDKITVAENREKSIPLVITLEPDLSEEIRINADKHVIDYPPTISLADNIIRINENICEIHIPIKGLKSGLKTSLVATYKSERTEVEVEVIPSRSHRYHGLIRDFKESPLRNPKEVSSFENGIIYVHTAHPVIKHYIEAIKKEFGDNYVNSFAYRMFRTNIIVEREKSGSLPKLDPKDPTAIDREVVELYYKYGKQFHNALCPLSRAIYIELE